MSWVLFIQLSILLVLTGLIAQAVTGELLKKRSQLLHEEMELQAKLDREAYAHEVEESLKNKYQQSTGKRL